MMGGIKNNDSVGLIGYLLINTISIFAVSYILPGIEVGSWGTALIVAVVMAVLNVTLKPFLIVITIPLTVITLSRTSMRSPGKPITRLMK